MSDYCMKCAAWGLGCNYRSEPLVHHCFHYHHVECLWAALRLMPEKLCSLKCRGVDAHGLLWTKRGWEPADECPSHHLLIDNPRRHSLYFPVVSAKWVHPLPILETLLMHLSIGFSFVPVSLSLLPCSYFRDYFPSKLPLPKFLSWALLLGENKLR